MAKKVNINNSQYVKIQKTVGLRYDPVRDEYVKKRKSFYGKTKKEAEQKAASYLESIKEKRYSPSNTRFNLAADYYMYHVFAPGGDFAEGTKVRYLSLYRKHITNSPFYRIALKDISGNMVQSWFIGLKKEGKSHETIQGINKVLGHIFRYLLLEEVISRDPLLAVSVPKDNDIKDDGIVVFTKEEVNKILMAASSHKNYLLFLLALGTGLRLSELTALQYKDITNEEVRVYKQVGQKVLSSDSKKTSTTLKLLPPKSKNSIRTVPVPKNILNIFEKKKKEHNPEDFIFATSNGNLSDPKNIRTQHRRILKQAGVEYKKFHAYRATYCTNLIERGAGLEVVYTLMGHSSIETTMKYYTFIENKKKIEAVEKINSIFEF